MRFKTIYEYDNHINSIDEKLDEFHDYVNNHPEKIGVQRNYELLKYIRDELKKERNELVGIIKAEEINIHFSGEQIKNHSIPSKILINFIQIFEEVNINIMAALEFGPNKMKNFMDANFKKEFGFNIKPFEVGSFMITFSPRILENNQSALNYSLNKKSFEKLCEIINFEENIDKIMDQSEIIGVSSIIKYKEFIGLIANNKLDLTIDNGYKNTPKVIINHNNALNIYQGLKTISNEDVKTEEINLRGVLYYINTDSKTCGVKYHDSELKKMVKISRVNFKDKLKSDVKDKFDLEVDVTLEKTIKNNMGEDDEKITYDLIEIR